MIKIKRTKLLVWVVAIILLITFFVPTFLSANAYGATKKSPSLSTLRKRVRELNNSLARISREYNNLNTKLSKANSSLKNTEKELDKLEDKLEFRQNALSNRVRFIYKDGQLGIFEVLVGTSNFKEFSQRLNLLKKISEEDAQIIKDIQKTKSEIEERKERLALQNNELKTLLKSIKAKQKEMEKKLAEQKKLLGSAEGKLLAKYRNRRITSSRSYEGYRVIGFIFPVAGPCGFSNDWLEPRSGGRLHKGNDIFALRGTPCVACVSGRVEVNPSRLGGRAIYLHGDDGNVFYYAHLDQIKVSNGEHVEAGEVIATVGNSGNARGGVCHLHFEFHPGGGRAVNPYYLLKEAF